MTIDHILGLCRQLAAARAARQVNREHCTINLLIDAVNTMPSWLLPPVVEPAAEVERKLACGASLTMRNENGALVVVLRDDETSLVAALTADEGAQAKGDLSRVLAAIGGAR